MKIKNGHHYYFSIQEDCFSPVYWAFGFCSNNTVLTRRLFRIRKDSVDTSIIKNLLPQPLE